MKGSSHGHMASFSVGSNLDKGEIANVGANNGFLPIYEQGNPSSIFGQSSVGSLVFFTLSPTITPKSIPTARTDIPATLLILQKILK